ncbi:MAG: YciI family protein [Rhodobacteraceae bacterium]|nr:YciI family protein [Paracoccaceae bacterium]
MPHFMMLCRDKPGHLQLRQDTREAHLAYIAHTGVVEQAGPLLDADAQMCGSLLILDVPDIDAARAWGAGDPYFQAGLFESVHVERWKKVIG